MKFCTSYRQNPDILHKVQQIRYSPARIDIAINWIEENLNTDAIIEIADLALTNLKEEQIYNLVKEHEHMYIDFYKLEDLKRLHNLYPIKRYMYHYPITSWIDLNYLLHFDSICAITIGEPLIFDLKAVKTLISRIDNTIQLRAWPSIGRPSKYNDYPGNHGLCHFWVLPQHVSLYDDYIDIFDILDENVDREKVLCDYYCNARPWFLCLSNFFKNMDTNVDGYYVDDEWIEKRLNCGQRCFRPSPTCYHCEDHHMLYDLMKAHPEILERKSSN